LREWIWLGRLKKKPALQAQITGGNTKGAVGERESKWKEYVNKECQNFSLIQELCNGSKHFRPKASDKVEATHQTGYGSSLRAYGAGVLGYGVDGIFVQVEAGRIVSVMHLLESARDFWVKLFERFPKLA
jgi:hypothetical protein